MPVVDTDPIPPDLAEDTPPLDPGQVDELVQAADPDDQPWRIEDDGAAEWALRMYAGELAAIAELDTRRRGWVERIDRWFERGTRSSVQRASFFQHHLERYVLRVREESKGKRKSVDLPSGRLTSRGSTNPKVVVVDAELAATWCEAHAPRAVEYKPTVKLTQLREVVSAVVIAEPDGEEPEVRLVTITGEAVPESSGLAYEIPKVSVGVEVSDA